MKIGLKKFNKSKDLSQGLLASLLGARMLLGAPGLTVTRNKKLLGAPGIATRSKDAARSTKALIFKLFSRSSHDFYPRKKCNVPLSWKPCW